MDDVHTKNPMKMFCISAFVICPLYFKRKLKIAQLAEEKAKEEQLKKAEEAANAAEEARRAEDNAKQDAEREAAARNAQN